LIVNRDYDPNWLTEIVASMASEAVKTALTSRKIPKKIKISQNERG